MNFVKRLLFSSALTGALFFGNAVEAGIVTDRFPIQMYVDRQLSTYNRAGDSRRAGWADANTDLIRVYSVSNGWARISHPGSGGRTVNRYCRVNELFADPNYSNRSARVKGAQNTYRTSGGSATIGSVSNNEEVIVLADNGRRAQIIYRLNNGTGYKIGWVPSNAVAVAVHVSTDGRMKGDVNGDGKVDRNDFDLFQRYYMGSVNSIPCPKNADLNGDGRHTLTDAAQLQIMIDRGHDPKGSFESYGTLPNQLRVIGYAYDEDDMNHKVKVHVYIDGTAGNSNVPSYEIRANKSHGRYNGHGFDDTITVPTQWCGRRTVRLYALNDVGGGTFKEIGTKIIDIPGAMSQSNSKTIQDGWYNIRPAHDPSRSLDSYGPNNNLHMWENISNPQQKFYLQNRSNGYFSLKSGGNGLYITATGRSAGANLMMRAWNGSDEQLFRLVDGGIVGGKQTYHIMAKVGSNLEFDCAGGFKQNATNAQLWTHENTNWHKWTFTTPRTEYTSAYRTNALRAAQTMVEVEWTAPCNFVTWCSSKGVYNSVTAMDGTRSNYFIAGKRYKGIPYSMKERSYTRDRFLSYVGQHRSTADYEAVYYGHGKKTTKIGIDCSYFVWTALNASGASRKIGGNYTTTSTLLNSGCFSQRSYANMKPGDIFLKRGSHVMMLVEKLANGQCVVYEADANDSKCSRNTYNPNSLSSSGYVGYTFIGYGD